MQKRCWTWDWKIFKNYIHVNDLTTFSEKGFNSSIIPICEKDLQLGVGEVNLPLGVRRDGGADGKVVAGGSETQFIGHEVDGVGLAVVSDERVGSYNVGLALLAGCSFLLDNDTVVQLEGGSVVGSDGGDAVVPEHADHWAETLAGGHTSEAEEGGDDCGDLHVVVMRGRGEGCCGVEAMLLNDAPCTLR